MFKCVDNGKDTCYSKSGEPKSRWSTDKEAIEKAKRLNEKFYDPDTKLVAYKCSHCHYYHLTRKKRRKRV